MLAEASTLANTRNLNWENKETVQLDANPSIFLGQVTSETFRFMEK